MEYRRLGNSGLKISALSFGSWVTFGSQVAGESAYDLMKIAYDRGVNFFDNAEVYAHGVSEEIMGAALKKAAWGRDTFCVSSKVFWGGEKPTQLGLSRKHIHDACHAALRRLQVDYLDLFFCHRPDLNTPIEETVRAMHHLIQQGKVLYWGTSEWTAQQITQAYGVAREFNLTPPTMEQPQYNLFHREKVEVEFLPLYRDYGLGTTIWSPLASGVLTGKYNNGIPSDSRMNLPGYEWLKTELESQQGLKKLEIAKNLSVLAQKAGLTLAELSIGWCYKNKNVSTIILGASKASQLEQNLRALEVTSKITPDVLEGIERIVQNKPARPTDYTE